MRKLIVHRKGYTRSNGTRVSGSSFKIRDRGKPGRGKKVIPALKKGSLGVNFSNKASTRHAKESALAKRIGERRVQGKLQAIATLNKRTNPIVSRKAQADRRWVAGSFKGRNRVKYPSGLK